MPSDLKFGENNLGSVGPGQTKGDSESSSWTLLLDFHIKDPRITGNGSSTS